MEAVCTADVDAETKENQVENTYAPGGRGSRRSRLRRLYAGEFRGGRPGFVIDFGGGSRLGRDVVKSHANCCRNGRPRVPDAAPHSGHGGAARLWQQLFQLARHPLRLLVLAALTAGLAGPLHAAEPRGARVGEVELKAVAFYNVIAFTHWPAEAFSSPDAPLVIAIVGQGPVATVIKRLVEDEKWHDRRVIVQEYDSADQIRGCHAVYVARSERAHWPQIRERFASQHVLAISDTDNFAADGGNVQLVIDHHKLHILVNLASTRATGVQLSSSLLRLATIVGPVADPVPGPQGAIPRWPLDAAQLIFALLP